MPLYHLTMLRLAPESVIQPGNWGRLLRRYENAPAVPGGPQFGNPWILARELLFENVRLSNHPGKPSRFNATFCFQTEADAEQYRANNDPHFAQVLHEVDHTDPTAATHAGDLSLIKWPAGGQPFFSVMGMAASNYWAGQGQGPWEIVSMSPIRVLRAID